MSLTYHLVDSHVLGAGGSGTVDTSGTPADNDFAKFTDEDTVEGRSYAETLADLSLEIGTDIPALNVTVTAKTDDYGVLAADFGVDRALSMNAAGLKTFTLPSVAAGDIGKVITFIKLGAGQVTIATADTDTIHDSSAGGTLTNAQAGETYASVTLMLTTASQWSIVGISGVGWVTT